MKIIKVGYEHPFNLGQYNGNEKVWFESLIEDGDNVIEVFDKLKETAVEWLTKEYGDRNSAVYQTVKLEVNKPTEFVKMDYSLPEDPSIDARRKAIQTVIELIPTKAKALEVLSKNEFRLDPTLNKIANSKP